MALFKVNTGTREQEVCGLRWDWEERIPELATTVFVIPGIRTKKKEARLIVLNRIARSVIEEQRGQNRTWVFHYEGRRLSRMYNKAWRLARRKASEVYEADMGNSCPKGFKSIRVHDLKHTFGRRLRSAGVSLRPAGFSLDTRTETSRLTTRRRSFRSSLTLWSGFMIAPHKAKD